MGKIGCLGDVIFTVSKDQVLTIENMSWNSSANYQAHDRHLQDPALEFTGTGSDEISLDIHLSAFLGVKPMDQIVKLFQYEREGKLLPLVIGPKAYGKYRWVITDTGREMKHFDGKGNVLSVDLNLKLKSYTR